MESASDYFHVRAGQSLKSFKLEGLGEAHIRSTNAGAKTGRSPRDKRVVREPSSENDIWWNQEKNGSPNFEMDER